MATNWSANLLIGSTYLSLMTAITPAGAFGFYAGLCLLGWLFCLFYFPETAGLSLEEVQSVFAVSFGIKTSALMRKAKERQKLGSMLNPIRRIWYNSTTRTTLYVYKFGFYTSVVKQENRLIVNSWFPSERCHQCTLSSQPEVICLLRFKSSWLPPRTRHGRHSQAYLPHYWYRLYLSTFLSAINEHTLVISQCSATNTYR
jgi:hypothetical protein